MLVRLVPRLVIVLAAFLLLPSLAWARTSHCGNLPASGVYHVVGHQTSCTTAKAVARAEIRALLTPGSGAKHYIVVAGRRWHYTWRDVNTSPRAQIEYYTARNRQQTVTFQTHGAN
jgi:hypothetical protein